MSLPEHPPRARLAAAAAVVAALAGIAAQASTPDAGPGPLQPNERCAGERWARETEAAGRARTRELTFKKLAEETVGSAQLITGVFWSERRKAWTARVERESRAAIPEDLRPPPRHASYADLCAAVAARDPGRCTPGGDDEMHRQCLFLATVERGLEQGAKACEALPPARAALCSCGITGDDAPCRALGPEAVARCRRAAAVLAAPSPACWEIRPDFAGPGQCLFTILLKSMQRGSPVCAEAVTIGTDHPALRARIRDICLAATSGDPGLCPPPEEGSAGEVAVWAEGALFEGSEGPELRAAVMASPPATCYLEAKVSQAGREIHRVSRGLALQNRDLRFLRWKLPPTVAPLDARADVTLRCVPGWW